VQILTKEICSIEIHSQSVSVLNVSMPLTPGQGFSLTYSQLGWANSYTQVLIRSQELWSVTQLAFDDKVSHNFMITFMFFWSTDQC